MFSFKKPNRNIRRREVEAPEDESDSKETIVSSRAEKSSTSHNSNSMGKSVKQGLLSFGEEWNEGDDGEVFKVKKSFQSKKIRRQMEKEKEERRKKGSPKTDPTSDDKVKGKNKIVSTEEVTIKIKNPIAGPVTNSERILSGLSAEMADYRSDSEDEDHDVNHVRHKFTPPDVKLSLKSGKIPDAALIHAIKKRKQQAREMGGAGFIPLSEETSTPEVESKSRLIREDDNDGSDDEERISMAGIVSYTADREKQKEGLDAVILSDMEDEGDIEDDEWEGQQLRKAVTGNQLAAVQQEALYMQYMNKAMNPNISNGSMSTSTKNMYTPVDPYNAATLGSVSNLMSLPTEKSVESSSPELFILELRKRMKNLEEVHRRHELDFDSMKDEIVALQEDYENRKAMVSSLAKRFQFYQDLRGYVTDLVECLDEKMPLITSLEQRLIGLYQKRATELINRRRQDVKDQMEDVAPSKNVVGVKKDEDRIRRAAEREGRRIRRMKSRSAAAAASHLVDGMSSDDEVTEMVAAQYRNQKEIIESDARRVFDDVIDEFVSIDDILKRFSEWRKMDKTAYVEAYANMCLPKVLGPILRMHMLLWNPLNRPEDANVDELKWIECVLTYAAERADTEESLRQDPDLQLVPRLMDKIVIPKLEQIVRIQWDPLSVSQTHSLVATIRNILNYPFIAPKSKLFLQLMDTIISRIDQAIENDVFIPVLPKQLFDAGKSNVFFQKQFVYAVKLYGNLVCWKDILNEDLLNEKANVSLLNKYLLMSIRMLPPIEAATKCIMVASVMPEAWLKNLNSSKLNLSQFFLHIRQLISRIDFSNPHGREAIEKLADIVKYTHS